MTTQTDYDIVGSYNNQRVTNIDAERSINLFEYLDSKGKKKKTLLSTSGITSEIIPPNGIANVFLATSGSSPNLVLSGATTTNWQTGNIIRFTTGLGGVLPLVNPPRLPLLPNQDYYIVSVIDGTTFTMAEVAGGTAVTFNTTGTAPIFVTNISTLAIVFPGLLPTDNVGFRAHFVFGNGPNYIQYVVIGQNVYSINTNNIATLLNPGQPLLFSTGFVGVDANQAVHPQIFFTENNGATGAGYIFNTTAPIAPPAGPPFVAAAWQRITDLSFPGNTDNPGYPVDATFLDGFFVTGNGVNNTFLLSEINQGLVWGPDESSFTTNIVGFPNQLIITPGNTNYRTSVPFTLLGTQTFTNTFTANATTDRIIPTGGSTVPFSPVGTEIKVNPATGGVLPAPLVAGTSYYTTNINPGVDFQLATTRANALAVPPVVINITTPGIPPNNISVYGSLPAPLQSDTTYYSIFVTGSTTNIQVAASIQDADAGIPIVLTSDAIGTGNTITSVGELQQGAITSHPGTIVACRTLHRRLFLFSQNFTEVWLNQGIGANLPFRRENSLLMEYGTPAIASVRVGFDKMFFLSQDKDGLGAVMMVEGAQAMPVSNRALDFQLAQYAANNQVADAWGILIKENGLIFYRLNFTAANHTYIYDVSLSNPQVEEGKLWHEEQNLFGNRHVAQTHGYFNGLNYYGSYNHPIIYVVDSSLVTNDGEVIPRIRITKAEVPEGYQRRRIDRMHVDLVQGVVADIPHNINPIVYMSVSKDGGVSYGNRLNANMGQIGQRTFRTVWRKVGTIPRGQAFVAKFEFFTQVPFTVLGGAWAQEVDPE